MTITAATFEFIDTLSRARIEQHPVWRPYDEDEDRESILGWGVAAEVLEQQLEKFEFCGTQLMYPVLVFDPLPDAAHLVVTASFLTADGSELTGYVFRPHAFGVYVDAREFSFNRSLPGVSARMAENLGEALGRDPEVLFPMRYACGLRNSDGSDVEGRIERYW